MSAPAPAPAGAHDLAGRLREGSLRLRMGPFVIRIRSELPELARWLPFLYADYPSLEPGGFSDYHVRVDAPSTARRWWRPQVLFRLDDEVPFKPLPRSQAFPFFEWGLNWCVARHAHDYLVLHAAVVERAGRVLLLPGTPGAGKSTLCAGLVTRGWRLLSDELALMHTDTGVIQPLPRPISLKGASVDVMRRYSPDIEFGPPCHDTAKGTVVHMRPPRDSVARALDTAPPAWVLFPRYRAGAEMAVRPCAPEAALQLLIDNAFNYAVQGAAGFHALCDLVERCRPASMEYSDLRAACDRITAWAGDRVVEIA